MWCLQKRRGGGVGRLLSALGTACAKDGAGTDLAAGQRCAPKGVEHSTAPMQRPEPDQGGGLSRPSSDDQELCARSCLLSGVCVGREGASCHLVTPRAGRQLSGARDGALAGLVLARGDGHAGRCMQRSTVVGDGRLLAAATRAAMSHGA
eukprot:364199-Chlamydomonas_euryale.AAC.16